MADRTNISPISVKQEQAVAWLVLNRPGQRNALSADLLADLEAALQKMLADKAVRVVILAGSGGHFCAGQDLSERDPRQLDKMPDLEAVQKQLYHPILARIAEADKPVIAAVDGIAAGAGAGLALHCDLVLASKEARFYLAFARLGLAVDAGLGWHLVRQLGRARTAGLLMTGGSLSAEEAHAAGLVSRVCEGSAQEAAADLAAQLAAGPQQALAEIKLLCRQAGQLDFAAYLQAEAAGQGRAGAHPDYAEGVLAFLQKRAAEFG
jgi:2-(1,2-epoxy-1,2-dihydrophenyl)acetyl-CoA isomerase